MTVWLPWSPSSLIWSPSRRKSSSSTEWTKKRWSLKITASRTIVTTSSSSSSTTTRSTCSSQHAILTLTWANLPKKWSSKQLKRSRKKKKDKKIEMSQRIPGYKLWAKSSSKCKVNSKILLRSSKRGEMPWKSSTNKTIGNLSSSYLRTSWLAVSCRFAMMTPFTKTLSSPSWSCLYSSQLASSCRRSRTHSRKRFRACVIRTMRSTWNSKSWASSTMISKELQMINRSKSKLINLKEVN